MSFSNILGQDRQIRIIKKALERERVPHAYLFLGEEGVGRRSTAMTLAKAMNCSVEICDSCDTCGSCRKITSGNHPDFTLVEPEGNFIKIQQIRELQRSLQFKPYDGKRKVCLIPNAEKMNPAAANALLKTLEEPPPDTTLILTTTSPHLLLPTINSRCQRLRFQPLSSRIIARVIKEKLGKGEEDALKVAALARGSLHRAFKLVEGDTLEYRDKLIKKINSLSSNDIDNTFKLAEEISKEKDQLLKDLEFLKTWFRDLLIFKEDCPLDRLINVDFPAKIKELSVKFTVSDLIKKVAIINEAQRALQRNSNKRLTTEVMLARLCQ